MILRSRVPWWLKGQLHTSCCPTSGECLHLTKSQASVNGTVGTYCPELQWIIENEAHRATGRILTPPLPLPRRDAGSRALGVWVGSGVANLKLYG